MAADGFSRALPLILAYEGGKVDDPRDPGGRTNQGVIQTVYNAWRVNKRQQPRDVYEMTDSERDAIYRSQFWDAVQGDKLPAGVDFVVFDGAVNSGPKQSIKWLQRALGVNADGVMGSVTLAALAANMDGAGLVDAVVDRREAFLKALKTFKTYGKGWLRRTASVRKTGKVWAAGGATHDAHPVIAPATPSVKAVVEDAKPMPSNAVADGASGVGVSSIGLGGVLKTAQDNLTPYSSAGGWIEKLVVVLIVAGALIAIGGLGYRLWSRYRKARMADALDTTVLRP